MVGIEAKTQTKNAMVELAIQDREWTTNETGHGELNGVWSVISTEVRILGRKNESLEPIEGEIEDDRGGFGKSDPGDGTRFLLACNLPTVGIVIGHSLRSPTSTIPSSAR